MQRRYIDLVLAPEMKRLTTVTSTLSLGQPASKQETRSPAWEMCLKLSRTRNSSRSWMEASSASSALMLPEATMSSMPRPRLTERVECPPHSPEGRVHSRRQSHFRAHGLLPRPDGFYPLPRRSTSRTGYLPSAPGGGPQLALAPRIGSAHGTGRRVGAAS